METRGDKYKASMIKKYGSLEEWREAMREFGARADKTTPRGFATMDAEKRSEISRKGAYERWKKQKANDKEAY